MLPLDQRAQLDRLHVVLVRARNPNNIGAVARAMHDFGYSHLRLVNEYAVPFKTARAAVDASAVLAAATEHGTLAAGVADCTLVLGTTAVGDRALEHPVYPLPAAAALIHAELSQPQGRVALLFGSEKTGLSNDELSHCHALVTIPMFPHAGTRHPSMNLGQAAAVCLYEILRAAPAAPPASFHPSADAATLERLTGLLGEILAKTGYLRRHPSNCSPAQLRRLILRMGLAQTDAATWTGILRQISWKLEREEFRRRSGAEEPA